MRSSIPEPSTAERFDRRSSVEGMPKEFTKHLMVLLQSRLAELRRVNFLLDGGRVLELMSQCGENLQLLRRYFTAFEMIEPVKSMNDANLQAQKLQNGGRLPTPIH
jgi:hypothetical protein